MYTRQEASRLRQAFWTTFGQYMQPVLSADGERTNWINYKTGIPGMHFRMDADTREASIAIVLSHPDTTLHKAQYEQLLQLNTILHSELGEEWQWDYMAQDEHGKTISKVSTATTGVNIMDQASWPSLISFFKPRIMALDAFWSMARYSFEVL